MFTDAEACYSRENLEVKQDCVNHVKQVKTTFYSCRRKRHYLVASWRSTAGSGAPARSGLELNEGKYRKNKHD